MISNIIKILRAKTVIRTTNSEEKQERNRHRERSSKRTRRVWKERNTNDKAIRHKTKKNTRSKKSTRTDKEGEKAAVTAYNMPITKEGRMWKEKPQEQEMPL